jgi:hypothetical protein
MILTRAKDEWFEPPDSNWLPLEKQLLQAMFNLSLAKDLTNLVPSDYHALVEARNEEVNRILDLLREGGAQ